MKALVFHEIKKANENENEKKIVFDALEGEKSNIPSLLIRNDWIAELLSGSNLDTLLFICDQNNQYPPTLDKSYFCMLVC